MLTRAWCYGAFCGVVGAAGLAGMGAGCSSGGSAGGNGGDTSTSTSSAGGPGTTGTSNDAGNNDAGPADSGANGGSLTTISDGLTGPCAVTTVGTVACVDTGFNPSFATRVRAVSVGATDACAITETGAVECWGSGFAKTAQPSAVPTLSAGITAVSVGWDSACALESTGAVVCWGQNGGGQLGDGASPSAEGSSVMPVQVVGLNAGSAAEVSVGGSFACAVTLAGSVVCWGSNRNGSLGRGPLAGTFSSTPMQVVGLTGNVTAVAAGYDSVCALLSTGEVDCWGGITAVAPDGSSTNPSTTAFRIDGIEGATSISVGGGAGSVELFSTDTACVIVAGGAVECWGWDGFGQIGNGLALPAPGNVGLPTNVSGLASGAIALSVGGRSACALLRDGEAECWGLVSTNVRSANTVAGL